MKQCPYCAELIQDEAVKCRFCEEFIDGPKGVTRSFPLTFSGWWCGYEYRSPKSLFGLPLVHIAQGINPSTGLPRIAKGIIAIGNIAIGFVAIGGFTLGLITICGIGMGFLAFGGIVLGIMSVGGIAIGGVLAIGGLAISAMDAWGGLAIGPNRLDSLGYHRIFVERLGLLVLWIKEVLLSP